MQAFGSFPCILPTDTEANTVSPTRQQQTVTGGAVPVSGPAATTGHVGLPAVPNLVMLPIETGARAGTAQGQMKKIAQLTMRLLETAGGFFGSPSRQDPLVIRSVDDPLGAAVPLFTGDKRVVWPGGYDTQGVMTFSSVDTEPMTIIALMPEVSTNG